jgi:hypothetical protein
MYNYPKEKTTILVKFLPNYNYDTKKVGEFTQELAIGSIDNQRVSTIHFSKVYMDGSITILKFGKQIKHILNSFMQGCYINSDGGFLTAKDNEKIYDEDEEEYSLEDYYLSKDGDVILPSEAFEYNLNDLDHRTDVVYLERFNPFDIGSKYFFQFDIDWIGIGNNKFLKYHNFKVVEKDPIWSEGEDRDIILELYKDVPSINDCIAQYKEDTSKNYPNTVFGEDAYRERGKAFDKMIIERMEKELQQKKDSYNSKYNIS